MTSNLTRLERALYEFARHTYNDHRLWRRIAIPANPMRVHPADCPRQPQRGPYRLIAPAWPESPARMPKRDRSSTGRESRMLAMVWTSSGHPISSLKSPPWALSANRHHNDPGGAIGRTIAASTKAPIARAIQVVLRIMRARRALNEATHRSPHTAPAASNMG